MQLGGPSGGRRVRRLTGLARPDAVEFVVVSAADASLEGVAALPNLTQVVVDRARGIDLTPLAGCGALAELIVEEPGENVADVVELQGLGLGPLRHLALRCTTAEQAERVAGLRFDRLRHVDRLDLVSAAGPTPFDPEAVLRLSPRESLQLAGFVLDDEATDRMARWVRGAATLDLQVTARDARHAAELRRRLPGAEVITPTPPLDPQELDGRWVLEIDLADDDERRSNADAALELRERLERSDPELLGRVALDPESSAVFISASSRADLERVRDLAVALQEER